MVGVFTISGSRHVHDVEVLGTLYEEFASVAFNFKPFYSESPFFILSKTFGKFTKLSDSQDRYKQERSSKIESSRMRKMCRNDHRRLESNQSKLHCKVESDVFRKRSNYPKNAAPM